MPLFGQHLKLNSFINLSIGVIVGILLSYFFLLQTQFSAGGSDRRSLSSSIYLPPDAHSHGDFDKLHKDLGPSEALNWKDIYGHHHHDDDTVAKALSENVRILCWTMTGPANHKSKAVHIKATWAKRCNKHVFLSSEADKDLDIVKLNIAENRDALWGKTKAAFKFAYQFRNEFDWFIKTDDDTYLIVENLRYMLMDHSPDSPIYFGRRFKPYITQGYFSGGAGYVLSREALTRFIEKGVNDRHMCRQDDGGAEDVEIGRCMESLGVRAGDSRDHLKRETFHPFMPESHLIPGLLPRDFWYWRWSFYPAKEGPDCCSDYAISFHYVPPNQMYVFEYVVYHLKPYGISTTYKMPARLIDNVTDNAKTLSSLSASSERALAASEARAPAVSEARAPAASEALTTHEQHQDSAKISSPKPVVQQGSSTDAVKPSGSETNSQHVN